MSADVESKFPVCADIERLTVCGTVAAVFSYSALHALPPFGTATDKIIRDVGRARAWAARWADC
jgi:hypothetical protein